MTISNKSILINYTIEYVKENTKVNVGHDWPHTERVWKMAKHICKKENGNMLIVELAALLHDVADWKFATPEMLKINPVKQWLDLNNVEAGIINEVIDIIEKVSFKGANVAVPEMTLEGKIVQDADRLDAIGAIGIARTFAYQGSKGRQMYDQNIKPQLHNSEEDYKKSESTSINHFYEKLLLIKDRLNTSTARDIAVKRHRFMEDFLEQFYREWEGEY